MCVCHRCVKEKHEVASSLFGEVLVNPWHGYDFDGVNIFTVRKRLESFYTAAETLLTLIFSFCI
jgi:hypothetical protein